MKLSTVISEDINTRYLAFIIDDESRKRLLSLITPAYENVICHHVTLKFNLSAGLTPEETAMVGQPLEISVRDIRDSGDGVQCLGVAVNGESFRPDGSFYHITHSISSNRKPSDSNKLRDVEAAFIKGIVRISGKVFLVKK